MFAVISIILLILVIIIISLALVLGLAVGIGWLLTLFLPFTLFEASLLGLIASVIVGTFWYNILNVTPDFNLGRDDDDEDEYEDEYDYIPVTKFYKSNAEKTWEAWVRFQIANSIYVEFQDSPRPVAPMGEKQLQELAIRLANVTIPLLKAKSARTKQLKVTMAALKKQMTKMGQRPYDDNILRLAVTAINEDLEYNYEEVIDIIRAKLWNAPCDQFDI